MLKRLPELSLGLPLFAAQAVNRVFIPDTNFFQPPGASATAFRALE
jgi:hypothetical protein